MASPLDTGRDEAEAFAQAEREKMKEAFLEWIVLKQGAPGGPLEDPPKFTWEQALEWAQGAWYLHHAAPRPFSEAELVFASDYWQDKVRSDLQGRRFQEFLKSPLPAVAWEDGSPEPDAPPPDPKAVIFQEIPVPAPVAVALTKLEHEDGFAVLQYIAQLQLRCSELTMLGLANFDEGAKEARPFVPNRRGPRDDKTLERYLHLGAMVAYLVRRGLRRTSYRGDGGPRVAGGGKSAFDAVALAAVKKAPSPSRPQPKGLSWNTIADAWDTFTFVAEQAESARSWQELFDGWRER